MSAAGFIYQISGRRFQAVVSSPILPQPYFYGTALKRAVPYLCAVLCAVGFTYVSPLPRINGFSSLIPGLTFWAAFLLLGFKHPMIKTLGLMMLAIGGTYFLS
jgi:hypothetical protein